MSRYIPCVPALGFLLVLSPLMAPCQQPAPAPPAAESAPKELPFLGLATRAKVPGSEDSGVIVLQVYSGSSAETMGFQVGDEIRAINDYLVTDRQSFIQELKQANVGAKMRFLIRRDGKSLKLSGRIGSYRKSMTAYQSLLRKNLEGKPLPALPGAVWWNGDTGKWEDGPRDWKQLHGKLSVVVSFDDCPTCRKERVQKISLLKDAFSTATLEVPLGFAGVYYKESPDIWGKKANMKEAETLLKTLKPSFPVAVAFYPDDIPTAELRKSQFLIHHHGIALIDTQGQVRYLQILGLPGEAFAMAYRKLLEEASKAGKKEPPAGGGE